MRIQMVIFTSLMILGSLVTVHYHNLIVNYFNSLDDVYLQFVAHMLLFTGIMMLIGEFILGDYTDTKIEYNQYNLRKRTRSMFNVDDIEYDPTDTDYKPPKTVRSLKRNTR
jgi:hypothetical protein